MRCNKYRFYNQLLKVGKQISIKSDPTAHGDPQIVVDIWRWRIRNINMNTLHSPKLIYISNCANPYLRQITEYS